MKAIPHMSMLNDDGSVQWEGSLHQYLKDNTETLDRESAHEFIRETIDAFRASMNQPHGRPEMVIVGGGAAPVFMLSLAA